MHVEHIAVWTYHLENLKSFYEKYFQAKAGPKYTNPAKGFESYFLTFPSGSARLELIHMPALQESQGSTETVSTGYAHLAVGTGSKEGVDSLTVQLQKDGFKVLDGPRWTGDGYYESVVLDPDGNRVEITI